VIYSNATAGVTITIGAGGAGSAQGTVAGDAASVGHDTFTGGVNAAIGSNFADVYDAHLFNSGFNAFQGNSGNDQITGNGATQVQYGNATSSVTITIGAGGSGTATGDGSVGTDTFTGVNSVAGSNFNDTIASSAANEVFIGNAGNDTFVFAANLGHDTINDFSTGSDEISLTFSSPFTPGSETSFQAWATSGHVTQQGTDTLITFDAADTILLKNISTTALHASDFIVHA
jgi:Ca2+-binding RTX toxin-like protein